MNFKKLTNLLHLLNDLFYLFVYLTHIWHGVLCTRLELKINKA